MTIYLASLASFFPATWPASPIYAPSPSASNTNDSGNSSSLAYSWSESGVAGYNQLGAPAFQVIRKTRLCARTSRSTFTCHVDSGNIWENQNHANLGRSVSACWQAFPRPQGLWLATRPCHTPQSTHPCLKETSTTRCRTTHTALYHEKSLCSGAIPRP